MRSRKGKAVERVTPDGKVVGVYRSAWDAARKCYISKDAVLRRCYGKVANPYTLDGHDYRFREEDGHETD